MGDGWLVAMAAAELDSQIHSEEGGREGKGTNSRIRFKADTSGPSAHEREKITKRRNGNVFASSSLLPPKSNDTQVAGTLGFYLRL